MQTLILNHYPPVIKQIKEIQQIAKAEDTEFSKLNASINEVIRNMFVFMADETGIQRFEKLLGIKPKAAQSPDTRRICILFTMNRRKMSLAELKKLLSSYTDIKIQTHYFEDEIVFDLGESETDTGMIYAIADEIIPINVYIKIRTEKTYIMFYTEQLQFSRLIINASFNFWKHKHLDGTRYLDGTRRLDGMKYRPESRRLDGEKLLDGSALLNGMEISSGIRIIFGSIKENVKEKAETSGVEISSLEKIPHAVCFPLFVMGTDIQERESAAAAVAVTFTVKHSPGTVKISLINKKNLRYLNGSSFLNGSGLINAEITEEVI